MRTPHLIASPLAAVAMALAVSKAPALAQTPQDHSLHHAHHAAAPAGPVPVEPGQAAFVTISEIVDILRADPETDWSRVDIDALRNHLIDMDNVMMRARVDQVDIPGGARFTITGDAATAASVQNMAVPQAQMLSAALGLEITYEARHDGSVWTVTGDLPEHQAQIRGLGFFGLITDGDHHQTHHLLMARGAAPH